MANSYTPEEIEELKAREADEIKRLGQATIETRMALLDMAAGTKGLTASLTKGFGQLGSSALGLTKQLAAGEVGASVFNKSIGGVADALGDLLALIPYVGGALKTLVKGASEYTQAVNQQADLLYKNYQEMSKMGATAADGMQGVYDNLKRMNYGTDELDKFVRIVQQNSQTLASFGKTVGQGVGEIATVAQAVQQSDLGRQFRDMGMSVDDINKGIVGYTKMQTLVGGRQKMTTEELIAASANYIKEVDLLAKITGKTREEQESARESAMAEERYAAFKYELEQRKKMGDQAAAAQLQQVESTQIMLDKMAPETRKGFLNILSGSVNMPEAQKLLLTMPNAAAVAGKETFTQAEFQEAALKDITENLSGAGTQLARIGANNDTFLSIQEQMKLKAYLESGTYDERIAAAKKAQTVTDQATKNMTDLQDANRKSRDNLQDLLNAGIVPVTSGMKGLSNAVDATVEGMAKLAEKLGVTVKKREAAPPAPAAGAPAVSRELQQDLTRRLTSTGITDKKAVANIMAQIDAESGGRTSRKENLNYTPEQLLKVFPNKFRDLAEAQAVVAQGQEAIGNKIYGGRMGNAENEGFLYRGRGLIQLTGKQNYEKFGKMLGIDLVKNPDLAADPEIAKQIAVAYFSEKQKAGVNLADIRDIGKAVGYAGGEQETQKRAGLASAYLNNAEATPVAPVAKLAGRLDDQPNNAEATPVAPVAQAKGGIIPAVPGGVEVLAAEAGMNEAFVPLPDGKTIPVQIAGSDEQMSLLSAQLDRLDQLVRIMQNQVGVSEKLLKYAQ